VGEAPRPAKEELDRVADLNYSTNFDRNHIKLLIDKHREEERRFKKLQALPVERKDKMVKALNYTRLKNNQKYLPIFTKKLDTSAASEPITEMSQTLDKRKKEFPNLTVTKPESPIRLSSPPTRDSRRKLTPIKSPQKPSPMRDSGQKLPDEEFSDIDSDEELECGPLQNKLDEH
jgi:hypothetical protein